MFTAPAQRSHDLIERQEAVVVARVAAQPAGEPGQHVPPPRPAEVVFHIHPQQAGVKDTNAA